MTRKLRLVLVVARAGLAGMSAAAPPAHPDTRAAATEARMTDDERFALLHGIMPVKRGAPTKVVVFQ